jgi:hypothetical protein
MNLTFRSGNNVAITATETSLAVNGGSTTLSTLTTKGVYSLLLDGVASMAKGDEYRLRIYEKASTGATKRSVMNLTISDTQSEPTFIPHLMLGIGWDMTLQRISTSSRNFYWSIRQASS